MRTCGHLYLSIALESMATTIMSLTFSYLLLLITNRGRLQNPLKAVISFVTKQLSGFYNELSEEVSHWSEMNKLPLERRFAMCRKVNQAICSFQILIGVLTIERWLHINNVNGFRYLGYSVTCPPMQTELILLIAPVVPCFRLNCVLTYFITTLMLLLGYGASVIEGEVYTGSIATYMQTWDLDDLQPTSKFWLLAPSCAIQVWLSVIQIPYLGVLYVIKGGVKAGLPYGYLKLLMIVVISWLAFPVWWALSFEGLSIIKDTKLNAIGFALMNVIAKGSFTLQLLSMTKWHRREAKRQECIKKGRRPSNRGVGLFEPERDEEDDQQVSRKDARTETWLVRFLRPFDEQGNTTNLSWLSLEPTYRAFLVGNGVTPSIWNSMPGEQRARLQEEYDCTFDLVVGEGAEGLNDRAACVKSPPHAMQDSHPAVKLDRSGGKVLDFNQVSVDVDDDELEYDHPSDAGTHGSRDGHPEPQADVSKSIRVGQTLTTVEGLKGRVVRHMGREVQLAVQGKRPKVVSVDDLTIVKVIFLGARGLQSGGSRSDKDQVFCSALIEGRPSSEVKTPESPQAPKATWDHEVEVLGFSCGDDVEIRVWTKDAQGHENILGEARIGSSEISDGGFEGELQLSEYSGKQLNSYVSVMVVGVNMPHDAGPPTGQEEFAMPLAKPIRPKVNGKTTADGRAICCF